MNMNLSKRKLFYIHFIIFKKILREQLIYSSNFDYLFLFESIRTSHKFVKFISLFNLLSRKFLGKTLDWNSVSAINDIACANFLKKNFLFDNVIINYNHLTNFYFLEKTLLNNFAKDCFFMFIGSALRIEEPLLNLVLRKAAITNAGLFLNIGSRLSSNFYIKHIGGTVRSFFNFITGNHWSVNLYFKSLYSFFCFGGSFFKSSFSVNVFNEFIKRGFGLRKNDSVFFSGYVSTYLTAITMGLHTRGFTNFSVYTVFNPLLIDFSFSSLVYNNNTGVFDKNRILVSFDHSFHTLHRGASDIIIPIRNFLENKKSRFVNSFSEILCNNVSFVRDVEKLFSMSYKKSYDFLVYDSKIINFGLLRSNVVTAKLDSMKSVAIKTCQFSPLLFFTYEHLYNTTDFFLLRKLMLDVSVYMNDIFKGFFSSYLTNNGLFFVRKNNGLITNFNWFKTINYFNLNNLSLVTNRVYFDPENDVFSNSSVLLLKTYKRLVIQMSNFN